MLYAMYTGAKLIYIYISISLSGKKCSPEDP